MPQRNEPNAAGTAGETASRTLSDLYEHAAGTHRQSVFMRKHHPWGYQSITFREFGALISYVGAGLLGAGLRRGDRVALIADNCPEWVLVYAAATACGAAIVPLDPRTPVNEIHHLLIDSEASFIVADPAIYSESIAEMRLENVKTFVIGEQDPTLGATTLGELMAAGKTAVGGGETAYFNARSQTSPDDIAVIAYAAVTDGRPKGAVLLHRNLASTLAAAADRLALREGDVLLAALPLHHAYAALMNILVPLSRGATVAFARSFKPRIILEDVRTEHVTVLAGVPRLFERIAPLVARAGQRAPEKRARPGKGKRIRDSIRSVFDAIASVPRAVGRVFGARKGAGKRRPDSGAPAASLAGVRLCVSSSGSLRPDVEKTLAGAGLSIVQGYGLTEASGLASLNPSRRPKRGTAGPALTGVEIAIDRPDEAGVGEIVVRGPGVMREYLGDPEATSSALRNGALHTGDLGRIDRDGHLAVVGRRASVIAAAGGNNIYPDEIEALLDSSPLILESVVVPVRDNAGGVRPGAVIVPDYDSLSRIPGVAGPRGSQRIREIIAAEIDERCASLPAAKRVAEFRIRDDELPRTPTGMLKRRLVPWIEE